jgi:diguanylate cyclase (GGDEF)-like protein/PAS domain S-box-containing protein
MTTALGYTPPGRPPDEAERLDALERYAILDTPPEENFDRILRLAARIIGVPAATISFVGAERQWFKSRIGVEAQQTSREVSFCGHTILGDQVMVVPDATRDPRFAHNPLVIGPAKTRFYAGAPLRTPDGHNLGTLCAIDHKPRELTPEDGALLADLAQLVVVQLELQRAGHRALAEIAERERAEAALLVRKRQLKEAQRLAHLGDWRWLVGTQSVTWSPGMFRIFGLDAATFEPSFEAVLDLVHADDRESVRARFQQAVLDRATVSVEFRQLGADGSERHFWSEARCELDDHGKVVAVFGVCQDITERRNAERRIQYLAHHDNLTGLPNRALFNDRLDNALARARRTDERIGLMLLDLDHFKDVNDSLGHDAGDALLREVGHRLRRCVRASDTVARLGGDEFAIILVGLDRASRAGGVAQKIIAAVAEPIRHGEHEIHARTSVGITIFPSDDVEPQPLLKNADIALYRAKAEGRGTYCFFQSSMKTQIERRRLLEDELRQAVANDRLELVYQPIVRLAGGGVEGFEALLRWRRGRELRSIAEVLPIAEETGLIVPIGEFVVRRAAAHLGAWLDAGFAPGRIALNLAAAQFERGDLTAAIKAIFDDSGLGCHHLGVEVTERVLLGHKAERVSRSLAQLHRLGVTVALDDFGTGYASLTHLKQFPVDQLKIDQTFVQGIGVDPDDAAIVRAVINLGHSLGKEIVAEGIETEAQLDFLRLHGCDLGQGYLFARPLLATAVPGWLSRSAGRVAGVLAHAS